MNGTDSCMLDTAESIADFCRKMSLIEKEALLASTEPTNGVIPAEGSHNGIHDADSFCFSCAFRTCFSEKLEAMSPDERHSSEIHATSQFIQLMHKIRRRLKESVELKEDGALPWSLPKGRRPYGKHHLSSLAVAIDELKQETGCHDDEFSICHRVPTYNMAYEDAGRRWAYEFFFADAHDDFQPRWNRNHTEQVNEVSAIEWHSVESFKQVRMDDITRQHVLGRMGRMFEQYLKYRGVLQAPSSLRWGTPISAGNQVGQDVPKTSSMKVKELDASSQRVSLRPQGNALGAPLQRMSLRPQVDTVVSSVLKT